MNTTQKSKLQPDSKDKELWTSLMHHPWIAIDAEMITEIDPLILKKAALKTQARFDCMRVTLCDPQKQFEYCDITSDFPIYHLRYGDSIELKPFAGDYPWKICFDNNAITLYICHGLVDGRASLEIMKTLLYYYLEESGISIDVNGKIRTLNDDLKSCVPKEIEEPFHKFYSPEVHPLPEKKMTSMGMIKKGVFRTDESRIAGRIIVKEDAFIKKVKELQTSPYALMAVVCGMEYAKYVDGSPSVALATAVDVRKILQSESMHNCIITPVIQYDASVLNGKPLDFRCTVMRSVLDVMIQKENVIKRMEEAVVLEKKFENVSVIQRSKFIWDGYFNTISNFPGTPAIALISYLGPLNLPKEMESFIKDIHFHANVHLGWMTEVLAFKGNMIFNLNHPFVNDAIFKNIAAAFENMGIPAYYEGECIFPKCEVTQ